jgi:hypothetical protein
MRLEPGTLQILANMQNQHPFQQAMSSTSALQSLLTQPLKRQAALEQLKQLHHQNLINSQFEEPLTKARLNLLQEQGNRLGLQNKFYTEHPLAFAPEKVQLFNLLKGMGTQNRQVPISSGGKIPEQESVSLPQQPIKNQKKPINEWDEVSQEPNFMPQVNVSTATQQLLDRQKNLNQLLKFFGPSNNLAEAYLRSALYPRAPAAIRTGLMVNKYTGQLNPNVPTPALKTKEMTARGYEAAQNALSYYTSQINPFIKFGPRLPIVESFVSSKTPEEAFKNVKNIQDLSQLLGWPVSKLRELKEKLTPAELDQVFRDHIGTMRNVFHLLNGTESAINRLRSSGSPINKYSLEDYKKGTAGNAPGSEFNRSSSKQQKMANELLGYLTGNLSDLYRSGLTGTKPNLKSFGQLSWEVEGLDKVLKNKSNRSILYRNKKYSGLTKDQYQQFVKMGGTPI